MKKIISLLASLVILMLPLIIYAASQPTFDWSGGLKYSHNEIFRQTLAEISEKATHVVYFSGLPVEYKTQDGSVVLRAYPDYGKSKCNLIHEEAWINGELVMNTIKEFCDRNFLEVPISPLTR
jgi:hypothetical protein